MYINQKDDVFGTNILFHMPVCDEHKAHFVSFTFTALFFKQRIG